MYEKPALVLGHACRDRAVVVDFTGLRRAYIKGIKGGVKHALHTHTLNKRKSRLTPGVGTPNTRDTHEPVPRNWEESARGLARRKAANGVGLLSDTEHTGHLVRRQQALWFGGEEFCSLTRQGGLLRDGWRRARASWLSWGGLTVDAVVAARRLRREGHLTADRDGACENNNEEFSALFAPAMCLRLLLTPLSAAIEPLRISQWR